MTIWNEIVTALSTLSPADWNSISIIILSTAGNPVPHGRLINLRM